MIRYATQRFGPVSVSYLMSDSETELDAKAQELGFDRRLVLIGIPLYKLDQQQKQIAIDGGVQEATEPDIQAIRDAWN